MNNIQNSAIRELDDESCVILNDMGFNNRYSQDLSQTSFNTLIQNTPMNLLVLGNNS